MSAASRFQFNKERILALPASAAGTRATYRDTKTPGLQLRVTPAGVKTFSMYRRTKGGGPERVTLGRFPAM
ncbi:Arm DNA-binding domain-containing protein, partial [Accumulibacter sp.]|uniref:Arm DNA-binding domain-containing protein n=1 Tax=Accumulibacter sp. TaxID=2053492 RepID=UPI002617B8A7